MWAQILADVLGVPARVPVVKESTALGAAVYAGLGAGLYASLDDVGPARALRVHRRARPGAGARATTSCTTEWVDGLRAACSNLPAPEPCGRFGARPAPDRPKDGTRCLKQTHRARRTSSSTRPRRPTRFFLKGSSGYDWGMQNRLARIFRPETGPHGHARHRPRLLPGPDHRPRAGRLSIVAARAARRRADADPRDACARRSRPTHRGGVVVRASGGPSHPEGPLRTSGSRSTWRTPCA